MEGFPVLTVGDVFFSLRDFFFVPLKSSLITATIVEVPQKIFRANTVPDPELLF